MGIVASLLVTAASALGWLESWQGRGLDLLLRLQGQRVPHDVVVVAIDETAFDALGRRQPIPRDYLARVIRGLQKAGAGVVGLDVTLAAPTSAAADAALARAIGDFADAGLSRVVLAGPLDRDSGVFGQPKFLRGVVQGTPRMPLDADGVIRRVAPVLAHPRRGLEPVLGVAVAARLGGAGPAALDAALHRGTVTMPRWRPGVGFEPAPTDPIAVGTDDVWAINFVGPARSFLTVPSDVVAGLAEPTAEVADDNPLRDRVVLIGGTFSESRDFYATPHGLLAGVEIHANVVHMLTTRRFIHPSGWAIGLGLQVIVVLVAGVVLLTLGPLRGTIACVAGGLLAGVPASYLAFHRGGYWVDFLLPVLATCVMGFGSDALARRRLRDSFSRYLSRELLARVVADAPSLRGERREVSILFSDLRGFTTLSETMRPEDIAAHLNEYFEAMTAAVFAHGGMLNDFVGDAVMAVFGAPVADPEHAQHAVQSAVDMNAALQTLNLRWRTRGLPALRMGVGIHTGSVFAGNVGGHDHIKYTVIGDPVNVASRVEGLNKELDTTILITEQTLAAVGGALRVRDCGPVAVKGRVEKVRVYEVLNAGGAP